MNPMVLPKAILDHTEGRPPTQGRPDQKEVGQSPAKSI